MRSKIEPCLLAILIATVPACASRTPVTSIAISSYVPPNDEPGVAPKWSVPSNGGQAVAIADNAVIVQMARIVDRRDIFGVAVYDIASGKELWHRDGPLTVHGTPLFLADGRSFERVDIRTGHVFWRTRALCSRENQHPSYVKVIEASAYAGCDGGDLFRINLDNGRLLASQDRISVDYFQQVALLPHAMLAVAGYASIGMYARTAILHAQTLKPIRMFTPDLAILGVRDGEAIVADVCCRGTPDANSPGAVLGVSLKTGKTLWSVAIHPNHPPLPLSDVEPGAGVFVLAGDRLYVGVRTALFVFRIGDLRTSGRKASRSELYSDLREPPQVYDGRYLLISEGKDAMVRRSALLDTMTSRELWSDASRPWNARPPETLAVAELYSVTLIDRRFSLIRVSDGKTLSIDAGCYLQAASERYAATLCGGHHGQLPQLTLFDFNSSKNVAALQSKAPVASITDTAGAPLPSTDPVLTRWTQHQWNSIGSTDQTYFFGRNPNGIVAVNRKSGAVEWQNNSVCNVARMANVINGILYVSCSGTVAILDRTDGRIAHKRSIGMDGVNAIIPAGHRTVVIEGWSDGAALRNDTAILNKNTLKPIVARQMSDSTFLGAIGDRAYIDDWCCFGRADQYRPATIYSISLKDGSTTQPIDLYPEPNLHPARMQPLGQGEHNYLQGDYFYVVTPNYTYRYDVRRLNSPPMRTVTPSNSPVNPNSPASSTKSGEERGNPL